MCTGKMDLRTIVIPSKLMPRLDSDRYIGRMGMLSLFWSVLSTVFCGRRGLVQPIVIDTKTDVVTRRDEDS